MIIGMSAENGHYVLRVRVARDKVLWFIPEIASETPNHLNS